METINDVLVSQLTADQLTEMVVLWIAMFFVFKEGFAFIWWLIEKLDDEVVRRSIAKGEVKE